ncbi:MAG: hypothetical protein JWO67_6103 [Streptosporangiaceae bacterium]|nr:hypothetical protein [Streptosporangiaceae bacterium]
MQLAAVATNLAAPDTLGEAGTRTWDRLWTATPTADALAQGRRRVGIAPLRALFGARARNP